MVWKKGMFMDIFDHRLSDIQRRSLIAETLISDRRMLKEKDVTRKALNVDR
jgi:hypothetical protein